MILLELNTLEDAIDLDRDSERVWVNPQAVAAVHETTDDEGAPVAVVKLVGGGEFRINDAFSGVRMVAVMVEGALANASLPAFDVARALSHGRPAQ